MTDEERVQIETMQADMQHLLLTLDDMPHEKRYHFLRAVLAVGSCYVAEKNHGVLLLVEDEESLKVVGLDVTYEEAGYITTQAADMFVSRAVGEELQRRGETH